jgi:hypothetical protein
MNKPDIVLSTGAVVHHRKMDNGATEAYIDDREMTNEEWIEYCNILHSR